jgi:tetratricopeptide (TPR) repeat protein
MFDYLWFFITDRNTEQRAKKYELLTRARKGDVVAMGSLAKLCNQSDDSQTALKWYGKIVKLGGPNAPKASNNIGNIYYAKHDYQQALDAYQFAAKQGLIVAKKNTGIVLEDLGQYANAISWYRVASNEGDAGAKLRLANLLRRPSNRYVGTWEEAEELAQKWMFYFGFTDAALTQRGSDGGIDVTSERAIAQVKYRETPTSRPDVQRLEGEAVRQGKQSIFFSLKGYSKPAVEWAGASTTKLALFTYDKQGNVIAENVHAEALLDMAKKQ